VRGLQLMYGYVYNHTFSVLYGDVMNKENVDVDGGDLLTSM